MLPCQSTDLGLHLQHRLGPSYSVFACEAEHFHWSWEWTFARCLLDLYPKEVNYCINQHTRASCMEKGCRGSNRHIPFAINRLCVYRVVVIYDVDGITLEREFEMDGSSGTSCCSMASSSERFSFFTFLYLRACLLSWHTYLSRTPSLPSLFCAYLYE